MRQAADVATIFELHPLPSRPAIAALRKDRPFREDLANWSSRPFAALQDRPCERTGSARKRSFACARKWPRGAKRAANPYTSESLFSLGSFTQLTRSQILDNKAKKWRLSAARDAIARATLRRADTQSKRRLSRDKRLARPAPANSRIRGRTF